MSENTTPATVKAKKTATIPTADVDFGQVAQDVSDKWTATPAITLNWTTAAVFATEVENYNNVLGTRKQVGGTRPQITKALKVQNGKIDDALVYVKGYILDKYKKESAPSYYAEFGMVHKTDKYILPVDQNKRSTALSMMKDAIVAHGFDTRDYGTAFWTTAKTDFDTLKAQAKGTDSTVSDKVGDKDALKATIKKTLNALIGQIKSNYPDNYLTVLRTWGFHKEKY